MIHLDAERYREEKTTFVGENAGVWMIYFSPHRCRRNHVFGEKPSKT
jgi:hypothetical protein